MIHVCKFCGQQFEGHKNRKYCSLSCAKSKDLSGKRFNHILVLSRNPDKTWLVKCDCGNTKSMLRSVILTAKSCTAACCKWTDFTGMKFGHLTVLHRVHGKTGKGKVWMCECDCGKRLERRSAHLTFYKQEYCHSLRCPLVKLSPEEKKRRAYECQKRYRAANREHHNEWTRQYKAKNKERINALIRARRRKNPEKYREKDRRLVQEMPACYVRKALGIRKGDVPPEVLPTLLELKRTQIQARRLVRNKKEEDKNERSKAGQSSKRR